MFIAALFVRAITWKYHRCPSTKEWIKKMWPIYTMEYYPVVKEWHIEIFMKADGARKKTILSEVTQIQKDDHDMYSLISGYNVEFLKFCHLYSDHHKFNIFHKHSLPFELRSREHIYQENANRTSSCSGKSVQPWSYRSERGALSRIFRSFHSKINTEHRQFTMVLRKSWVFLVSLLQGNLG